MDWLNSANGTASLIAERMFLVSKQNGFSRRTSWFFLLFISIVLSTTLVACGGRTGQNNTTSCDGSKAQVTIGNAMYVVTYHEWPGVLGSLTPNPWYDASPTCSVES